MRTIDENGNEVFNSDEELGYGWKETIVIAHHEAQDYVPDVYHYETVAEYRNEYNHVIGEDVIRVIDVPGHKESEAWDETEEIIRWHWYTPEEIEERENNVSDETALRIILGLDT